VEFVIIAKTRVLTEFDVKARVLMKTLPVGTRALPVNFAWQQNNLGIGRYPVDAASKFLLNWLASGQAVGARGRDLGG